MAAATSSTIPAKGLMWEPLRGHSKKQFPPMCQGLQNTAPPYNGKGDNRLPELPREEVVVLNGTCVFHQCSFQGAPVWGQGNRGVYSYSYLCCYAAARSSLTARVWRLS